MSAWLVIVKFEKAAGWGAFNGREKKELVEMLNEVPEKPIRIRYDEDNARVEFKLEAPNEFDAHVLAAALYKKIETQVDIPCVNLADFELKAFSP